MASLAADRPLCETHATMTGSDRWATAEEMSDLTMLAGRLADLLARSNQADQATELLRQLDAALVRARQHLAEASDQAAALRGRAANLETLNGLLETLTGVLDVREVFDRVSAIAQQVLPHDALALTELVDDGRAIRVHACTGLGEREVPFD